MKKYKIAFWVTVFFIAFIFTVQFLHAFGKI